MPCNFNYMQDLKTKQKRKTNEKTKSQIQRTDQLLAPEVGGGKWVKWMRGVKMYKLPIVK